MGRFSAERISLKNLQTYHHAYLNNFNDQETLVEAISNRPGFCGHNPIAYLSLVARRPTLELSDLDEALFNDKTLIRVPAFRGALCLISSSDYPIYFRTFHNYLQQKGMSKLNDFGINKSELLDFSSLLKSVHFSQPLSLDELFSIIFTTQKTLPDKTLIHLIAQKLCDMGVLIRIASKGWKGNNFNYMLLEKWLKELSLNRVDNPEVAKTETVRKYLRAYGPVAVNDISYWSGLSIVQCQKALLNLKKEIVRVHVDGYKEDMIALKESMELMKKKLFNEEEVLMLPSWDPYTSGWDCKKRLADKEFLPFIFDAKGNATSVIVYLGKIIGVWQFREQEVGILEFCLFEKYLEHKPMALYKIQEFCGILKKISKLSIVNILERPLLESLDKREENAFLWPLGKNKASYTSINNNFDRRTSNILKQPYLDNSYLIKPADHKIG